MLGLRDIRTCFPVLEQQLLFDVMMLIALGSVVTVKLPSSPRVTDERHQLAAVIQPFGTHREAVASQLREPTLASQLSRANSSEPTLASQLSRANSREVVYPGEPPDRWLRTDQRSLSLSRSAPGTLTPHTADNARYVKLME